MILISEGLPVIGEGETPVPIPNTEVKPLSVHGSSALRARNRGAGNPSMGPSPSQVEGAGLQRLRAATGSND